MKSTANTRTVKKSAKDRVTARERALNWECVAEIKLPTDAAARNQPAWPLTKTRICLAVLTLLCLLPFVGKAFHIDDTLFVWAAKQIVQKPFDPFGFPVVWYNSEMPMSEVTKNPPLAAYYSAVIGSMAGWSEHALHLAFLLPALVVVLGIFQLARELTSSPLIAGVATLVAPGFLISSTSIMSDVPMLALWIMAIILWRWGLGRSKPLYLATSGLLIGACALTKYFGACLIPLVLLYSIWKEKRLGSCLFYLLIPIAILGGYQAWTSSLYGQGLLTDAASYASEARAESPTSFLGGGLTGLAFVGGCTLPALLFIPWLWRRTAIMVGSVVAAGGSLAVALGWLQVERSFPREHQGFLALQLLLFLAGGLSVLALAASDAWQRRDADSILLAAWVAGTFVFASYLNWTVNARSVLPLIPAAAILLARRLDEVERKSGLPVWALLTPLLLSGLLGFWVAWGDAALANSARHAARVISAKTAGQPGRVFFSGHWGFQYYMQLSGAKPLDLAQNEVTGGDLVVQPENNSNAVPVAARATESRETIDLADRSWVTTMRVERAAGFYSAVYGVMPFAFGSVPDERYVLVRLRQPSAEELRDFADRLKEAAR